MDNEVFPTGRRDYRARLLGARLYVLITKSFCRGGDPLAACREAVDAGADMVQFREKTMEDGEFYRLAEKMQELCGDKALFVINDRVHIAQLLHSPMLHTGQGDLPIHLSRKLLSPDQTIGISTANPEDAARAFAQNADCIGIGPVYPTGTKALDYTVGLDYVRWTVAHSPIPYFCIGGINRETIGEILETGARGFAICSAIIGAPDVAEATAWFRRRIDAYPLRELATREK